MTLKQPAEQKKAIFHPFFFSVALEAAVHYHAMRNLALFSRYNVIE